jgi:predicted phage-related endonuclease
MKFGIIPEAMYVAADATIRLTMGDKPIEALLRASEYLLPGDQTKLAEMMEAKRLTNPETAAIIGRSIDYKNQLAKIDSLTSQRDNLELLSGGGEFDYIGDLNNDVRNLDNQIKQATNALNTKFKMTDAEQIYADRMQAEVDDIRKSGSLLTKIKSIAQGIGDREYSDVETLGVPEKTQEQLNLRMAPQLPRDLLLASEAETIQAAKVAQALGHDIPDDYYLQQQQDIKNMSLAELAAATSPEQVYGASGTMGEPVKIDLNLYQPSDRFGSGSQQRPILYPEGRNTLAGGGIAKQAGVDSGPPPESGPNPQGLSYLMKRGRNI